MDVSEKLYMEQVVNESEIKSSACSKENCVTCDNLVGCYMDASRKENDKEEVDYGGYETEMHYY